jgi:putative serine protease PepD
VSSGIVSAVRTEDGVRYIQFTAPISPGNSGGPVLDAHGKVIGISVAKAIGDGAEGLSFAIPAAVLCSSFDVC